jgi:TolB protein
MDKRHDTTIAQLLTHLGHVRQAVPVNYKLKAELKQRLLEQMKQMQKQQQGAVPVKRSRRGLWWFGGGMIALSIAACMVFLPNDGLRLHEQTVLAIPAEETARQVSISPRGDRIAYLTDNARLHAYPVDHPEDKDLFSLPSTSGRYESVVWSNSSQRIAVLEQTEGASRLWMMQFNDGGGQASTQLLWEETGAQVADVSWSPDGRQIAYTKVKGDKAEVWINNLATYRENKLAEGSQPDWSSDGKRIAYVQDGVIQVADLTRGVTAKAASGMQPSWQSPDRFTYLSAEGRLMQARLNEQTGTFDTLAVPLYRGVSLKSAEWARDGKHLLVAKQTKQGIVFAVVRRE